MKSIRLFMLTLTSVALLSTVPTNPLIPAIPRAVAKKLVAGGVLGGAAFVGYHEVRLRNAKQYLETLQVKNEKLLTFEPSNQAVTEQDIVLEALESHLKLRIFEFLAKEQIASPPKLEPFTTGYTDILRKRIKDLERGVKLLKQQPLHHRFSLITRLQETWNKPKNREFDLKNRYKV